MKKWYAPLFSLIPFAYGLMSTVTINSLPAEFALLMGPILGILFLVMWNRLAKIANFYLTNDKKTLLYMHIPGFLVVVILFMNAAAQEPFLHGWFQNIVLYYLAPTMPIALLLSMLIQNVYFVYAVCLLFMLCAAYMGCHSKRRYVK